MSEDVYTSELTSLKHDNETLIRLFNQCFEGSHHTVLVAGEGEPIYLPADRKEKHHRIEFAHGYFSSALHEIAHWCIAGPERRLQVDYGYWYFPDGRNAEQQAEFERLEIKPQALEWALSLASNYNFTISTDNLSAIPKDPDWAFWEQLRVQQGQFVSNIKNQLMQWVGSEFPQRAQLLIDSLCQHYRQSKPITTDEIENSQLWKRQCQLD